MIARQEQRFVRRVAFATNSNCEPNLIGPHGIDGIRREREGMERTWGSHFSHVLM